MMRSLRIGSLVRATSRVLILPLVGMAVGLVMAVAVTALITPTYEASASVIVLPKPNALTGAVQLSDVTLAQTLVTSVALLAQSRDVALAVAKDLKLPPGRVIGHLTGVPQLGVQIVTVEATASNRAVAAAIADSATKAIAARAVELDLGGSTVEVKQLDSAGVPSAPTSPRPLLNYALGALVGLLAGAAGLTLRSRFGDRFERVAEIEEELGMPAIGVVKLRTTRLANPSANDLYASPKVGLAVDGLVAALSILGGPAGGRRILVTGVGEEDSSALVAALLAVGMQRPERGTTLLEGMLSNPAVDRFFTNDSLGNADDEPGKRRPARKGSPKVLTLGADAGHLARDARFSQIGTLVDELASNGDDVVVRAPSVLAGRGLAELADHADIVILTVDSDRARRADAGRAALLVQRLDVPVIGLVITGAAADDDGWQPSSWPGQAMITGEPVVPARRPSLAPVEPTRREQA